MRWIGLTGGIASGKSTVSRLLRAKGHPVVDADILSREAVQVGTDGYREVIQAFGPDIVLADGELDRKRIGEIVFANRSKLTQLENIVHPRVRDLAVQKRAQFAAERHPLAFYDVPLLFEKKMQSMFEKTVLVTCTPAVQIQRIVQRDGLTPEAAQRRLSAQMPLSQKLGLADEVVLNNNSLQELEAAVDALLKRI
jgi:dephospho-CoA kinase